ncbi:Histidine protein methyltransferase 1 [Elsinoe australis]|uniref:protein-histidine N-methyltransferase n=1 Tax=Elsinoe australis TaxID=40998 RepID=A0A2P8A065_9PEZI|nr:Histidine protein methyltransferase 1 [Elsinoe australis]
MSFAFNFSGDDIEADHTEPSVQDGQSDANDVGGPISPPVPVQEHSLSEWLQSLPSRLTYTITTITSPSGKTLILPRRDLFDIRAQLMAEDNESTLSALSTSDLSTNVYEGGFKTWECSLDLASLLLDRGPRKDIDELSRVAHVIELGAGSAMPTLVLFDHAFRNGYRVGFTLADYNADVLRLVTVPNLLLMWARGQGGVVTEEDGSGDLEVTEELMTGFERALKDAGIDFKLLSGPWGEELKRLVPASVPELTSLVLAAETIYSPASLQSFVNLVHDILREGRMNKAYVAAKKFYFGVGGSVDALKVACRDKGMVAAEVENSGLTGMDAGVGRAVVEIQMY